MKSKSSITTREALYDIVTPGEILREEFMKPMGLTSHALAIELRVPANRIQAIVNCQRGITADTALRFSQYFGNSPEFWLNLQQNFELDTAKREKWVEIQASVPRRPPAAEQVVTRKPVRRTRE